MGVVQIRCFCPRGRRVHPLRSDLGGREQPSRFGDGASPRTDYDAVCVLGGGYRVDGSLPVHVQRRVALAHALHKRQSPSCKLLCIGAGTPHKPPLLDEAGHVRHESTLLAEAFVGRGVSEMNLVKESASYDTVGNAYFALVGHAIPAMWDRLAIVTSDFHMPRTEALFGDIFRLAEKDLKRKIQSTRSLFMFCGEARRFLLEFFASSDEGIWPDEALTARIEREATSLDSWNRQSARFRSLKQFHAWLHETHQCYAVSRQHEFSRSDLDAQLKQSY